MRFKINSHNKFAIYSIIIGISYLFLFVYYTIYAEQNVNFLFGIDYAAYHAAGQMVLNGDIHSIYDIEKHHGMVENVLQIIVPFELPWFYPPTFFLFVLPLAILPYEVALYCWLLLTLILCIYAVYVLTEKNWRIAFLILGFPAVLMNLRWGQNGFLNTALLALGFYFMQVNTKKAGIMFGLLAYKPQILFFPVLVLLLCKKWTTLLWTGLTFLVLSLISILFFGLEVWKNFIFNTGGKSAEIMNEIFSKILVIQPTVYAFLKILGVKDVLLFLLVLLVAISAVGICAWICRVSDNFRLKISSVHIGIFLSMPYLGQYDLIILGIPLVLLFWDFTLNGSCWYEKVILFLFWVMPIFNLSIVEITRVQICPIILAVVMAMICWRVCRQENCCNKIEVLHE